MVPRPAFVHKLSVNYNFFLFSSAGTKAVIERVAAHQGVESHENI